MIENYKQEIWLDNAIAKNLESFDYWNSEDTEKKKEWYVVDGDFLRMENHIKKTGLEQEFLQCINLLQSNGLRLQGAGIDLAAGNLWSVPYLFQHGDIEKLYCLEFSTHRLLKIGPVVLEHYRIPKDKVILVLGSFYEIKLPDNSLDFVFLSQAFHHAEDPHKLLQEIKRVLKPGGVVLMIGEIPVKFNYLKNAAKYFITKLVPMNIQQKLLGKIFDVKVLFPKKASDVFTTNQETGDHYYTFDEYMAMFKQYNFQVFFAWNGAVCPFVLVNS